MMKTNKNMIKYMAKYDENEMKDMAEVHGRTVYDGCHQPRQGGGGLPITCPAGVRVME